MTIFPFLRVSKYFDPLDWGGYSMRATASYSFDGLLAATLYNICKCTIIFGIELTSEYISLLWSLVLIYNNIIVLSGIWTWDLSDRIPHLNLGYRCLRQLCNHGQIFMKFNLDQDLFTVAFNTLSTYIMIKSFDHPSL